MAIESTFYEGSDVQLVFDHVDGSGIPFDPVSATYTIKDKDGNEIKASASVSVGAVGSTPVSVDSVHNVFAVDYSGDVDYRLVTVVFSDGSKNVTVNKGYFIKKVISLVPGENSFQTLESAKVLTLDIVNIDSFKGATDEDRIISLKNAFQCISKYTFNIYFGTDYIYSGNQHTRLNLLTPTQINELNPKLLTALKRAQVMEASHLLSSGAGSVEAKRSSGLISETIGESSNMFRTGKPVRNYICKYAMNELSEYIVNSVRVGR